MGTIETQLLFAFLLAMLKKLIEGRSDTSELEKKVAQAKDIESLRRILVEAGAAEIGDMGEAGALAEDLIKADNSEAVVEIITRPGIIEGILNAIGGLFAAVFGGKKQ